MPQLWQNFASPDAGEPQLGQNFEAPAGEGGDCGTTWVAPQFGQNFTLRGIIEAQLVQLLS